jgi:ketosteroid isomerase-like protein
MGAVAARNPEALRSLLTEDYEVWAHAAAPIRGIDAAVAAMAGAIERFRIEQRFDAMETIVAGDWAFERGIERMTIIEPDTGVSRTMAQRAFLILRLGTDGQWRYARGMTNGLPPDTPSASDR